MQGRYAVSVLITRIHNLFIIPGLSQAQQGVFAVFQGETFKCSIGAPAPLTKSWIRGTPARLPMSTCGHCLTQGQMSSLCNCNFLHFLQEIIPVVAVHRPFPVAPDLQQISQWLYIFFTVFSKKSAKEWGTPHPFLKMMGTATKILKIGDFQGCLHPIFFFSPCRVKFLILTFGLVWNKLPVLLSPLPFPSKFGSFLPEPNVSMGT